jgi:hypothetical protein
LHGTEVANRSALSLGIDSIEESPQQEVFSGQRGISFELGNPVSL